MKTFFRWKLASYRFLNVHFLLIAMIQIGSEPLNCIQKLWFEKRAHLAVKIAELRFWHGLLLQKAQLLNITDLRLPSDGKAKPNVRPGFILNYPEYQYELIIITGPIKCLHYHVICSCKQGLKKRTVFRTKSDPDHTWM